MPVTLATRSSRDGDGLGDGAADTGVERGRDDVVVTEDVGDKCCEGVGGGELHCVADVRGTCVERTAEDAGERQDVVDLVRKIRPAGGDDPRVLSRQVRVDL